MNEGAMEVAGGREVQYPLTAMAVVARVRLIQEVMQAVMKKETHYGVIPGCNKPSLWKPGAEQLLVTFRIATEAEVQDLSTPDEARYRVIRRGTSNGQFVGSAVGECSSNEEKYKWRGIVCDAEYDATPEDRRRLKFRRDGGSFKQVRTNHADVANTILKMADKRAYVALALQTTAASDIFTQDLEDLPPEVAESLEGGAAAPKPEPIKPPVAKAAAPSTASAVPAGAIEIVPSSLETKPGEKDGKQFVRYSIKLPEGGYASTFDENMGFALQEAKDAGVKVRIFTIKKGQFTNIAKVEAI